MEPSEDPEEEPSPPSPVEDDTGVSKTASEPKIAKDTDELLKFRRQWKEELELKQYHEQGRASGHASLTGTPDHTPQLQRKDKDEEATGLYWMGVAAEQSGDMHAAIMYYRQAVQLDPDVEFKAYRKPAKSGTITEDIHAQEDSDVKGEGAGEDSESDGGSTSQLIDDFHSMTLNSFCEPAFQRRETHISALPIEIMRYILRWVVSAQLDMRSLEQVSKVQYCYIREKFALISDNILETKLTRLWGDVHPTSYNSSWRKMFILKPHLHFNGVYISKTSYVRPGERSLDGFYKPYHTVVYYRYLRFFPDGSVMYETSPMEPAQVVGKLCHKHSSESVHLGKYTVHGDKVMVDVLTYQCYQANQQKGRGRTRTKQYEVTHEQRLHMEFTLLSVGKSQRYNQLKWLEHYCHSLHRSTGQVQVNHFTIDYMYTPFSFSRVKRYSTNSFGLLT